MVLHGSLIEKTNMFSFYLGLHVRNATHALQYVWRGEIAAARDSAKAARYWYEQVLDYAP